MALGAFGGGLGEVLGEVWGRFWGGFGEVLERFSGVRKPIKNLEKNVLKPTNPIKRIFLFWGCAKGTGFYTSPRGNKKTR